MSFCEQAKCNSNNDSTLAWIATQQHICTFREATHARYIMNGEFDPGSG